MNSEKVKEIKEKLQEEIFIANSFGDKLRKVPTKELENLLTLINELESENKMLRLERDVLIGKKIVEKQKHDKAIIMKIDIQKQLKNRIAELEEEKSVLAKQIEKITGCSIDDLSAQRECNDKLKQFAERLKEKASYLETENRGLGESSVDRELDEILKVYRYDETRSNRSL